MRDDLLEQSLRLGNAFIHLVFRLSAWLRRFATGAGKLSTSSFLPSHHSEEMLSMLVIVLRFHRIPGCLRERHITLVLSSGIRQDIVGAFPRL
jgi:hypothetical protein